MKKVVVLGDSVSRGIVLKGEKYTILSDGFVDKCAESLDWATDNYSKMGCTISKGEQILEQHKQEVSEAHFTMLEYGGNDSDFFWKDIADQPQEVHSPKTNLQQFHATYTRLIQHIRSLGSQPILLSLPLMDGWQFFNFTTRAMSDMQRQHILTWLGGQVERIRNYHDMYNLEVFHIAREQSVPIVDITSPFLTNQDYTRYLCADGIHPSEEGHALIAQHIIAHWQQYVED